MTAASYMLTLTSFKSLQSNLKKHEHQWKTKGKKKRNNIKKNGSTLDK